MANGTLDILSYLINNPGSTIVTMNRFFTKIKKSKLTTATIYRQLKRMEEQHMVTRLPTDRTRLIVTPLAEEILIKRGVKLNYLGSNKWCFNMSFNDIIQNLGNYYEFGSPISHDKFTVYPIVKALVDFTVLGIIEGEHQELAWIQESEGSESVQQLEAINKSEFPVLIPYLHQVEGGKQDRTIFEPILIPIGFDETKPLPIPARCIEQSRWRYSSSRGQATTARFQSIMSKMAPQMANVAAKAGDQSTVWNTVGAAAEALDFGAEEAPTSSYREIQEKSYEKDDILSELLEKLSHGLNYENQVGIICTYGDHLLGVEIFGSSTLWNQFNEAVLKGFLADRVFMQKIKTSNKLQGNLADIMRNEFFDVKISKEKATGTGDLYKFSRDKWEGICVQYQGIPAHFYAAKKHVDILKGRTSSPFQNIVQTTQDFPSLENEIRNRAAPEQIVQEQRQR